MLENRKKSFIFRVILLVFAVSFTHIPFTYAETLPERLTAEKIMNYVLANGVSTVEELIEALPPLHKRHFALIFGSEALNKEFVSGYHPRVVSWGADSRFLITWSTNPDSPGKDKIEFLQLASEKWVAGIIDFSGDTPELSNPPVCSTCHGHLNKPLWGSYPTWVGTENENSFQLNSEVTIQNIRNALDSTDPRLSLLESEPLNSHDDSRKIPVVSSVSGRKKNILEVTKELSATLIWRHAKVLVNRLKARDDYMKLAERIMCGGLGISDLYKTEEHNPALMEDGNKTKFIQGSTGRRYNSSNGTMSDTFDFLILYDLWLRDERISRLYKNLSNEEVSPIFYSYLSYHPGTATAEDELLESYRRHFGSKGQDSLNTRVDSETLSKDIESTAIFGEGHLKSMAPRVCKILGHKNSATLPEVYIEDGLVGEDSGKRIFTVNLDPGSEDYVEVTWIIVDDFFGVTDKPTNYSPEQGSLTFPPGEKSMNIEVEVKIADEHILPLDTDATFRVVLRKAPGALITDSIGKAAIVTVQNNIPTKQPIANPTQTPTNNSPSVSSSEEIVENREEIEDRAGGCALALKKRNENATRTSLFNSFLTMFALFTIVKSEVDLKNLIRP